MVMRSTPPFLDKRVSSVSRMTLRFADVNIQLDRSTHMAAEKRTDKRRHIHPSLRGRPEIELSDFSRL